MRVSKNGLNLKVLKWELVNPEEALLGQNMGKNTVIIDPQKLNGIQKVPKSCNQTEFWSFLVIAGNPRSFTLFFAAKAVALHAATSAKIYFWLEK